MNKYLTKLLVLFSIMALGSCEPFENKTENTLVNTSDAQQNRPTEILNKHLSDNKNPANSSRYSSDIKEFENILLEYASDVLNREKINIMPGVYIQKKATNETAEKKSFDENLIWDVKKFAETHSLKIDLARAMSGTGRLFFFKGKLINKVSAKIVERPN